MKAILSLNQRNYISKLAFTTTLVGLLYCQQNVWAMPRSPLPPIPEQTPLYHETFDGDYFLGDTNCQLVISGLGVLDESWSGYALERTGSPVEPFIISALNGDGSINITSDTGGALRFWIKPHWTSGGGPASPATLLELDAVNGTETAYAWSLQISPDGNTLELLNQTDAGAQEVLQASISWQTGSSHNVILDFNSQNTAIYLDGALAAEGSGVTAVPPSAGELVLGSALSGTNTADADFDEFYSFSNWLSESDASSYLVFTASEAALGPISATEEASWGQRSGGFQQDSIRSPNNVYDPDTDGGCVTGVPVYITNLFTSLDAYSNTTVSMDIQGGTNGVFYDVYTTANLAGSSNFTQWTWLGQVLTCNTYIYSNQPPNAAFYIVAAP
jgi:hypothetical protein